MCRRVETQLTLICLWLPGSGSRAMCQENPWSEREAGHDRIYCQYWPGQSEPVPIRPDSWQSRYLQEQYNIDKKLLADCRELFTLFDKVWQRLWRNLTRSDQDKNHPTDTGTDLLCKIDWLTYMDLVNAVWLGQVQYKTVVSGSGRSLVSNWSHNCHEDSRPANTKSVYMFFFPLWLSKIFLQRRSC